MCRCRRFCFRFRCLFRRSGCGSGHPGGSSGSADPSGGFLQTDGEPVQKRVNIGVRVQIDVLEEPIEELFRFHGSRYPGGLRRLKDRCDSCAEVLSPFPNPLLILLQILFRNFTSENILHPAPGDSRQNGLLQKGFSSFAELRISRFGHGELRLGNRNQPTVLSERFNRLVRKPDRVCELWSGLAEHLGVLRRNEKLGVPCRLRDKALHDSGVCCSGPYGGELFHDLPVGVDPAGDLPIVKGHRRGTRASHQGTLESDNSCRDGLILRRIENCVLLKIECIEPCKFRKACRAVTDRVSEFFLHIFADYAVDGIDPPESLPEGTVTDGILFEIAEHMPEDRRLCLLWNQL